MLNHLFLFGHSPSAAKFLWWKVSRRGLLKIRPWDAAPCLARSTALRHVHKPLLYTLKTVNAQGWCDHIPVEVVSKSYSIWSGTLTVAFRHHCSLCLPFPAECSNWRSTHRKWRPAAPARLFPLLPPCIRTTLLFPLHPWLCPLQGGRDDPCAGQRGLGLCTSLGGAQTGSRARQLRPSN